jgi:hypothetical protein
MTIIASWGGSQSNAYIGLTDAASVIETTIVDYSGWSSATSIQQGAAIIAGAIDIDARNYLGSRYYYDQMMEFPRALPINYPWNRTSTSSIIWTVEMTRMRDHVERANCHQALWILRNSGRNLHAERVLQGIKSFSEKIGPLSEAVTYRDGGGAMNRLCPEAIALLSPWRTTRRIVRG